MGPEDFTKKKKKKVNKGGKKKGCEEDRRRDDDAGSRSTLRLGSHLCSYGSQHGGACSLVQVRISSEFLPEFAPAQNPIGLWSAAAPDLCELAPLQARHTRMSCELDAVKNPHPIGTYVNPAQKRCMGIQKKTYILTSMLQLWCDAAAVPHQL